MLAEAARLTRRNGRTLRLDVDAGNTGLRRYYERVGFTHVRDVTGIPRTHHLRLPIRQRLPGRRLNPPTGRAISVSSGNDANEPQGVAGLRHRLPGGAGKPPTAFSYACATRRQVLSAR